MDVPLETEYLIAPPLETAAALAGCRVAHARLLDSLGTVDDAIVAGPSRLPTWTVGHVLTHLARQADSHVRMLEGAAGGAIVDQYEGGPEGRAGEIEVGARRPADAQVADVAASIARLEATWDNTSEEVWARGFARTTRGELVVCADLPFRRWREVEVHHADLGLDVGPESWSAPFVDSELPHTLAGLPARMPLDDRRALLAWLMGRAPTPPALPSW